MWGHVLLAVVGLVLLAGGAWSASMFDWAAGISGDGDLVWAARASIAVAAIGAGLVVWAVVA